MKDTYTYVRMCCLAKGTSINAISKELDMSIQDMSQKMRCGVVSESLMEKIASCLDASYVVEIHSDGLKSVCEFLKAEYIFCFIDNATNAPIISEPLVKPFKLLTNVRGN